MAQPPWVGPGTADAKPASISEAARYGIDYKILLTSALAYALATSWNEAFYTTVQATYPTDRRKSAQASILYAVVITLVIVALIVCYRHASSCGLIPRGDAATAATSHVAAPAVSHLAHIIKW